MARVLVLGGGYFIGRWIADELIGRGHQVFVLSRGSSQGRHPEGAVHLGADRTDRRQMEEALAGREFDLVVEVSWLGAAATRLAMELLAGRVRGWLFVSSAAVYAPAEILPYRPGSPLLCELYPSPTPATQYGWEKGVAEGAVARAAEKTGFAWAAVRPFYVYGEGNNLDRESYLMDRVLEGGPLLIPGSGEGILHLGHIEDLARLAAGLGELLLSDPSRASGRAINFGGPELVTVEGLYRVIEEVVGAKPGDLERVHFDPREVRDYRRFFPFRYRHFFGSLEELLELGLYPRIGLREGMERTWRWWQVKRRGMRRDFSSEEELVRRLTGRDRSP